MQGEAPSSGLRRWLRVAVIGRDPKRTLIRLAVLAVFSVIVFTCILMPVRVTGISMEPTYPDHSVNFINRLAYVQSEPRRGDVVGLRLFTNTSAGHHEMLLKRVVGLPGESVSFRGGRVCIDGVAQIEPYLKLVSD